MFKGGFGYYGNRYDVIKCLERNLDIPVTSQSMIYFGNQTHEIFLLNCPNAYISCKKPSRASLSEFYDLSAFMVLDASSQNLFGDNTKAFPGNILVSA